MKMKEVCLRTGLTERTVRFYAGEGLIKPASSEMNGRTYFDFSETDIKVLENIAVLRKTGFSIEQIETMQKKPAKIREIIPSLQAELERHRDDTNQSLTALGAIKPDVISDIQGLALALRSLAEKRELPAADLEPDFGRFDIQNREEKQEAYREFIINSAKRGKRKRTWELITCALLIAGFSVFFTLLTTGQFKGPDPAGDVSAADYLVSQYEAGDVELTFEDEAYSLTAEGLDGGTLRMTRVYSDGKIEFTLSWSYFTEPENQLIEQSKLKTGVFVIERSLGNAVLMAVLPSETEGEYFAVYASSEDMTAEEQLKTVSGRVKVECGWGIDYKL